MSGGYEVWRGPSEIDGGPIVAIATRPKGSSPKLGPAMPLWILRADVDPDQAMRARSDASVCGGCAMRPQAPGLGSRACYVHSEHLRTIWRAWRRASYPPLTPWFDPFEGRVLRLGGYGDPVALPVEVLDAAVSTAASWTGYTHQWREPRAAAYQHLLMASVDNPAERADAAALGWRTFRSRLPDEPLLPHEVMCPASPEGGHRATCATCVLCDGLQGPADARRDITIIAHGWGPAVSAYRRLRGNALPGSGARETTGGAIDGPAPSVGHPRLRAASASPVARSVTVVRP